jgi:tetratricopeptide (TPR) repeat protein
MVLARLLLVALLTPAALSEDALRESRKEFLRARQAVADGRYREALTLYRRVLERLPDDAVVHVEYAQLLRELNVLDEATVQAREAVRLDPEMAEARKLLGTLELGASEKDPSRLDAAIEHFRAARRLSPRDAGTASALARALLARGRPAEAAAVLDEIPEARTHPALMRLAAQAKARSGKTREAVALYRQLIAADPADRDLVAALVDVYESADDLDRALETLRQLEAKDPDNSLVAERITLDLARAGRFAEAEKKARELAARRPENRAIRRLLAGVLFEKGDIAGGERILRALIEADPDDSASRRALASELARERRFDEARGQLEDLVRRAAEDPKKIDLRQDATVELGYLAFLEKDFEEARRILEPLAVSGSKVRPRAARIALAAAREAEDFTAGLELARRAAGAEPQNPDWTAAAAEMRWRSGDAGGAQRELDELAASGDLESVLAAADAWVRLKKFDGAVRAARQAAQRHPEEPEALFRLGSTLERGGEAAESEQVFQRLLALRPNDAAAQNYLGYMWADRGVRLDEARELLEKAVAREPRNAAYRDSLGWVYFRLGRLEGAEKELLEAHRREPDDPTIEEHLGDLSHRKGDLEKAVAHWERAIELKHEEPEKIRAKLQRFRSHSSER